MKHNILHLISITVCCAAVYACSIDEMESPDKGFSLRLNTKVESMDDVETKASLLNSSSSIPGDSLTLYGWEGDSYWIQGKKATFASSKWTVPGSYTMSSTKNYSFLAYANVPSSGASISAPTTKSGDITYTVTDITSAQNDVLLGSYSVNSPSTGDVDIDFSHPYASVKFKLGNAYGVSTISSVSLDGVYSSGKTTFSQSSTKDAKDIVKYTWTNTGNANATLTASAVGDSVTFVVIPQDLTLLNAVVTVTYDSGSKMTRLLSEGAWVAGYTTSYSIDKYGDIIISVSGTTVTNTGQSKVYLRATITGAWYDGSGNIVAPWSSSEGTFTGLWSSAASDGYYYYANALATSAPGNTASVFTSYSKPSAPVAGATLKLDVIVQAIPYSANKTCQEAFAAL